MHKAARVVVIVTVLTAAGAFGSAIGNAADAPQTMLAAATGKAAQHYPKIVLYSVSWCPHCKAAKEYFTANNIPFINRDVEVDEAAMTDLTKKYKSQGVPVIVIDEKVLRGFDQATVEKTIKEHQKKESAK